MKTKIEWATHTWNPVTGCTPISEGCEHCYAARMAKRLAGRCGYPHDDPFRPGTVHSSKMDYPLKLKNSAMIFVCSMGDLFHESMPADVIEKIFEYMRDTPWHTFLVLTKRPSNVVRYLEWRQREWLAPQENSVWPSHVWLGVTSENQARADERIPILLSIPAAVRFVSVEPMLGPVDLSSYIPSADGFVASSNGPMHIDDGAPCISWVICGGETGPGARPMHPDWARSLRNQCKAAGVPFFMKKMSGGVVPTRDLMVREYPEGAA
jgi:protein gp37